MFRHTIRLGRIFGIEIDLDYSWFLVFGLLTWVLAVNYYPAEFKNWRPGEYWLMGALTAIMLFVSGFYKGESQEKKHLRGLEGAKMFAALSSPSHVERLWGICSS